MSIAKDGSMANLALEIKTLADAYARKLNELHDDYVHTKMLWNSIQFRVLRYNDSVIVQNPMTGSATAGVDLANKAPASLERLNARSFKDIVAQFELFVAELLRLWVSEKPTLIAEKAINVATLLASRSLADAQSAAIREAVESTIAGLMYGRPDKWFNYLRRNLSVRFTAQDEMSFLEMKARRDVLEHNNGIVEATYREKAKAAAKFDIGDHIQLSDPDIDETFQLAQRLVRQTTVDATSTT